MRLSKMAILPAKRSPVPSSGPPVSSPNAEAIVPGTEPSMASFEAEATAVLGRLRESVSALLACASGPTGKCTEVQESFGIDPKLAWQVFRLASAEHPLAAGAFVPARISMERLLRSAGRRRMSAQVIAGVEEAFGDFERFVAAHAGERETLDAMLGAFLPEMQEKQDLARRELVFRGMSQIRGVTIEAEVSTYFLAPSSQQDRADYVQLSYMSGIRRFHPLAHAAFGSGDFANTDDNRLTLDGVKADGPQDTLLPEFCLTPLPKHEQVVFDPHMAYIIASRGLGLQSAVDLARCEYRPGAVRRYKGPDERTHVGIGNLMGVPVKRLIMTVLIHKDLFPDSHAEIRVYDNSPRGYVTMFGDPKRERDRLRFNGAFQAIPGGLPCATVKFLPQYQQMLQHVCAKRDWEAGAFRGYRLDVQFPLYGGIYLVGIRLPDPPRAD